jgi:hypothetical protein
MRPLPLHGLDTTGADATNDTPRYNPATGRPEWAPGGGGATLVPLTTTVSGVPELVWDDNDNLVMTEVPT